jgi:hypothetical protein
MDSGVELSAVGSLYTTGTAIVRVVRYDVTIIDTKLLRKATRFAHYSGSLFAYSLRGNAAARSRFSASQQALTHPFDGAVAVAAETFAVAHQMDNTIFHPDAASFTSQVAAQQYLERAVGADPTLADSLHVLPRFEVAA